MTPEQLTRFNASKRASSVLHLFERERPDDDRPRRAVQIAQSWAFGEATDRQLIQAGREAGEATTGVTGAAKHAARAAWSAALFSADPVEMARLVEEDARAAEASEAGRALAGHHRTITATCAVCGAEVTARAYGDGPRYCSGKCKQAAQRARTATPPQKDPS